MTRQAKTPQQRAEETLARTDRLLTKACATRDRLRKELHAAELDAEEAQRRRDYAAQDPALKDNTSTPSTGGTTA